MNSVGSTAEKVRKIVAEESGASIEHVTNDATLGGLGIGKTFGVVEFLSVGRALEREFGIRINDSIQSEPSPEKISVGDIITRIENLTDTATI